MREFFSSSKNLLKLIEKLLLVLCLDYLVLLSLEIILPGMVNSVFNLNYLLLAIVIGWLAIVVWEKDEESSAIKKARRWQAWLFRFLIIYLVIILAIALFRVSHWQLIIYLLLSLLSIRVLYPYLISRNE